MNIGMKVSLFVVNFEELWFILSSLVLFLLFIVVQLACEQCDQVTDADGTAAVAVPMLSLRLFSNCFKGGPGSLEAVTANLVR